MKCEKRRLQLFTQMINERRMVPHTFLEERRMNVGGGGGAVMIITVVGCNIGRATTWFQAE